MRLYILRCIFSTGFVLLFLSACSDNSSENTPRNTNTAPSAELDAEAEGEGEDGPLIQQKPTVSPPEVLRTAVYICNDGLEFRASFLQNALILDINDDTIELRQQASASGALYSNYSMSFHSKGSSAIFTNDIHSFECESDKSQTRGEL